MRRQFLAAAFAVGACFATAVPAGAAVHLTQMGSFSSPVYVAAAPGDPHRLFVVEQAGRIQELRDGQKLSTPFLDITGLVRKSDEQGLLSMAFAPDYATSRKFYVYYTAPRAGDAGGSVLTIEEFRSSATNPDAADPASGRIVTQIDHPDNANHNGGQLQFGPDGALYAGTGDGGSANDPPGNAQNAAVQLGKLLRIDPATNAVTQQALGLRNPWRFSFDRQTGDLVIADVGQARWEEVDFTPAGTPAGLNYGWRCFEGFERTSNSCTTITGMTPPVLVKSHSTNGTDDFCAIVGGYVVRDPALGPLNGRYLYGDNCKDGIRAVTLGPGSATGDQAVTGLSVPGLTSFGEDSCGHVYAASGVGSVYRIDGDVFTPCSEPPTATPPPPDTRAPSLGLFGRSRQRVMRQHAVRIGVTCSEDCAASLTGAVRIAGVKRRYRLRTVSSHMAAGALVKLRLRWAKSARGPLVKALRHHRRVTIRVSFTGRDAAGNAATRARTVRAIR